MLDLISVVTFIKDILDSLINARGKIIANRKHRLAKELVGVSNILEDIEEIISAIIENMTLLCSEQNEIIKLEQRNKIGHALIKLSHLYTEFFEWVENGRAIEGISIFSPDTMIKIDQLCHREASGLDYLQIIGYGLIEESRVSHRGGWGFSEITQLDLEHVLMESKKTRENLRCFIVENFKLEDLL